MDRNFHTRFRATTRSRVKVRRRAPQWCVTINLAGSRITGKRLQRAPTCASALFPRSRKEEREGEPSVRSLPWQRRTTSSRHAQQSDGAANPFPTTTTTGTFPEAIDRDTLQESPPAVKSITHTTTTTCPHLRVPQQPLQNTLLHQKPRHPFLRGPTTVRVRSRTGTKASLTIYAPTQRIGIMISKTRL